MAGTTLPGVLLTGNHAGRPAANAVGTGTLYSCTTHSLVYQSDGSSWSTWATLGGTGSGSITASGYTQNTAKLLGRTTASSGAIEEISVGSGLTFSGGSLSASGTSSWPPLDQYSIDGTYGDLFNGGSLNARWTRRNYVGGAETFGFTKASTGLRIAVAGRTNGDGYLQTAPAGDWTFAMKYATHQFGANTSNWGIAVVDSAGSGLVAHLYNSPAAFLIAQLTTYTTYGGSYVQSGIGTSAPNVNMTGDSKYFQERPIWLWLRKSGTSYYVNVSVDGEAWWVEGGPITWSGTVDRIGMLHGPIGTATGGTGATNDVYWFNKIA